MKTSKFFCSLICFAALAQADEPELCGKGANTVRAGVRHIEGNGIGYNKGYTTAELFIGPPCFQDKLPFVDLRGHVFDNGKFAFNGGLGYRQIQGTRVYGVNAYYDYRTTSRHHYNQVGVGLEVLGKRWDGRVNGYWPVGSKESHWYNSCFGGFSCNQLLVKRKQEFAMKGVHAEVGAHLNKSKSINFLKDVDFYSAIGPYYFEGKGKNAYGGKFRVLGKYEWLAIEASTSYDNVFKDIYQAEVSLIFPLGAKPKVKRTNKLTCNEAFVLRERLAQPVSREEIIVVDHRKKCFVAEGCNCIPLNFIFVNNCFGSKGTFEDPFGNFLDALNSSKPGDIFYVFPGDGTHQGLFAFENPFQLLDNQMVLGAANCYVFPTNFGDVRVPALASRKPIFSADNDVSLFNIANNNTISGLHMRTWKLPSVIPVTSAIENVTNSVRNLRVENNIIEAFGSGITGTAVSNGISLTNPFGDIIIRNNTIRINGRGVTISAINPNTNFEIIGNEFFGPLNGLAGIRFSQFNGTSTLNIQQNKFDGLIFGLDFATFGTGSTRMNLVMNTFSDTTQALLNTSHDTSVQNYAIRDNQLNDLQVGFGMITADTSSGTYEFTGNSFETTLTPISLSLADSSSLNALIVGNKMSNSTNAGVVASTTPGGSGIPNVIITSNCFNNSGVGVFLDNHAAGINADIENNTMISNNQNGIFVQTTEGNSNIHIIGNTTVDTYTLNNLPPFGIDIRNNGGTMCLRFNENQSKTDTFDLLINSGVVNLEPPVGNNPELTLTGIPPNIVPPGTCGN